MFLLGADDASLDFWKSLPQLGGYATLIVCGWMVLTGKLCLRRELDKEISDKLFWVNRCQKFEDMANRSVMLAEKMAPIADKAVCAAVDALQQKGQA